jgi:hypothetical protein
MMAARLLLSNDGLKTLSNVVFKAGQRRRRAVTGSILGYQAEGIWFQDSRLLRLGEMVLIKWNFIDAILSEAPAPEPLRGRAVGFRTGAVE